MNRNRWVKWVLLVTQLIIVTISDCKKKKNYRHILSLQNIIILDFCF